MILLVAGLLLLHSVVVVGFGVWTSLICSFGDLICWFAKWGLVCACVARKPSHIGAGWNLLRRGSMGFVLNESSPRPRLHVVVHIVVEVILLFIVVDSRVVRLFVWWTRFAFVTLIVRPLFLCIVGVLGLLYFFLATVAVFAREGWTFSFCRVLI